MARRTLLLWAGAVLALLTLAACGGDDGETGNGGVTQPGGDGTPAGTTPAGRTPTSERGDGASAVEELRARVSEQRERTLRMRYALRGSFEGQEIKGSFELAQKPPKLLFRMDLEGAPDSDMLGGAFAGFTVIDDGTDTYLCFKADTQGMCLKGESDTANVDVSELLALGDVSELVLQDPDVKVEEAGSRKVGGIDSDCYRAVSQQFEGLFCLGKEQPVLTYVEGTVEGEQYTLELEEYGTDVPDSLFEPPYPVSDFGGFFSTPTPARGN
ncbi:hypothetical protein HRbin29_01406 [bacterium HR29]|nr:hypothetical protein HRbin29_01406 [bacterium HR29]